MLSGAPIMAHSVTAISGQTWSPWPHSCASRLYAQSGRVGAVRQARWNAFGTEDATAPITAPAQPLDRYMVRAEMEFNLLDRDRSDINRLLMALHTRNPTVSHISNYGSPARQFMNTCWNGNCLMPSAMPPKAGSPSR